MINVSECLPYEQVIIRINRCRELCSEYIPQASGILVFSRLNIYYFTGTWANGVLYIPLNGEPVLMIRENMERAMAESPLKQIFLFTEYAEILGICKDCSVGLGSIVGAEMNGLSWNDSKRLQDSLKDFIFVAGDKIPLSCREIKSEWELNKMRLAGQRHNNVLYNLLPQLIHAGMNEREISIVIFNEFFKQGHSGMNRMGNFGEGCFLGHIAAGENGNYPSHFNGPLGLKGVHPASPFMGNRDSIWQKNSVLSVDAGFVLEGYHTDKTQVYWSGRASDLPDKVKKAQDVCIEIQNYAANALRSGAIPSQIWNESCIMAKNCDMEEGYMGLGQNKVKFLGHGIGLVIDESPVLADRFDSPLMEGMVMAIEPKIGIEGYGMVGLENTFEITEQGGKSITGNAFNIIFI